MRLKYWRKNEGYRQRARAFTHGLGDKDPVDQPNCIRRPHVQLFLHQYTLQDCYTSRRLAIEGSRLTRCRVLTGLTVEERHSIAARSLRLGRRFSRPAI